MIKGLKNHPFAVEAHFESSIVLTFAVPKEELQPFIPPRLELDTFEDKWAFIAIAMVQTRGLRPKGFPRIFGNDFLLIGYRIFVKYTSETGKKYRGLYIIKSETNKKKMAFFGNIFTHYNYTTTDIEANRNEKHLTIHSHNSRFNVEIDLQSENVKLPSESPFNDWKTARKFAGPLPFTFTYNSSEKTILIIEGVRKNWKPNPIEISTYSFEFLQDLNLKGIVLANAFEISNIPYYWKKGRIEQWK